MGPSASLRKRLRHLENHLKNENPVLLGVVRTYRELDRVGRGMGLLARHESWATQISWWPLVSVLGTFSAGKSTFINHFLRYPLQRTGNQAVDDRFTVICYSQDTESRELPGVALDADPRFPFYQVSKDIEQVAEGEGQRIDAYLQLKTCPSERLRGKILIDSPGFDADAQRSSTLRITRHIVDLSDLVLVLFDARHPEPGAMRDTLEHLVAGTINRPDSGKFLYILNQIDTAAREDNPEEVVGSWQRALAEHGLTAGRFYTVYNPDVAVPIANEHVRQRFERKRDADLAAIHDRMSRIETERAYRIVGALEKRARDIGERIAPAVRERLARWRSLVTSGDIALWLLFAALMATLATKLIGWETVKGWWPAISETRTTLLVAGLACIAPFVAIHYTVRQVVARWMARRIATDVAIPDAPLVARAFLRSTRFWRGLFRTEPAGWGRRTERRLDAILAAAGTYVQSLNDRFARPSGGNVVSASPRPAPVDSGAAIRAEPQRVAAV